MTSDQQRVIKKYPNRRLYDTQTSTYITLSDVKQLVIDAKPFVVLDAKTQDDLTRSLLLQIILEEESGGVPLFSQDVLANMIRFYGKASQGYLGQFLEKNIQSFVDMQNQLTTQTPVVNHLKGDYVEQSQKIMLQMQEQMRLQSEQIFKSMGLKS